MGIRHIVLPAAARQAGHPITARDLTETLARQLVVELSEPGMTKPGRPAITFDDVMEVFRDHAAAIRELEDAQAFHAARRADFSAHPIGRQALAELRQDAEGRPVAPIGEASAFDRPERAIEGVKKGDLLPLQSPIRPFVRDLETPIVDADDLRTMLTNLSASVHAVFVPALRDGSLFERLDEVLKAQHRFLVDGPAGRYGGHTGRDAQTEVDKTVETHAGRFLAELRVMEGGARPDELTFSVVRRLLPNFRASGLVRIEGLPEEALPQNVAGGHLGPQIQFLPLYLAKMTASLERAFASLDRPEGLRHLSDYLHVATNTHLFPRGNNSIFMSHVNYALERMGLLPIPHGQLDFTAYIESFDAFRGSFYAAIAAENPGVELPKT